MAEPIRSDLKAPLEGCHILIDPDALTFGLLEDLQSDKAKTMMDALAAVIVGGDLPKGTDRAGLRQLKPAEIVALIEGVGASFAVSKS